MALFVKMRIKSKLSLTGEYEFRTGRIRAYVVEIEAFARKLLWPVLVLVPIVRLAVGPGQDHDAARVAILGGWHYVLVEPVVVRFETFDTFSLLLRCHCRRVISKSVVNS